MTREEIVERLKKGDRFYNPNTGGDVIMSIIEWDGVGENARAFCVGCGGGWAEDWDDMRFTINAFLIGEYKFV